MEGLTMDRNDLIVRLARVVAQDAGLMLNGWAHLVLISVVESGAVDVSGFCYTEDGRAVPVSPTDFALFDAIDALRQAMAEADDGRAWLAALFRIRRADGKLSAEFEYEQAARWAVTPANVQARAREFQPA
jgi:hypothetical protein